MHWLIKMKGHLLSCRIHSAPRHSCNCGYWSEVTKAIDDDADGDIPRDAMRAYTPSDDESVGGTYGLSGARPY